MRVTEAQEKHDQTVKRAKEALSQEVAAAKAVLIRDIDEAEKSATRRGDLDEALEIRQVRNELQKNEPIEAAVPVKAVNIPPDAIESKGHHYKVYISKASWHEARHKCEEMGGYLACINDAREQEFIAGSLVGKRQQLWLGATDESTEGQWRWLDGSSFSYSNWKSPQPDNQLGYGDYLVIQGGEVGQQQGEWNDFHASGLWLTEQFVHGFICEWDQ